MEILSGFTKLIGIFCIVLLNGFFVAAEYAIVKVRITQIEPLAKKGNWRARRTHHVITHLDTYVSATQLGITLTSLGLGWIGEPFFAHGFLFLFASIGLPVAPWVGTLSVFLGFSLMSYVLIVAGELGPRWYALQNAQRVSLGLSTPLHVFYSVFRPFIWFLNHSASFLLRGVGITPAKDSDVLHSEEEMRLILGRGRTISALGRSISLNAFDLRTRTIREVMVPRTGVTFLSTMKSLEENLAIALKHQFTRYPLCEKDLDHVLGVIHLKDLFRLKGEKGPGELLLDIKRDVLFVPETMSLDKILHTFLAKRVLMAVAVDEYGGTAGLITLRNVLEEIVGDIRDEFDNDRSFVQKVREGEFLIDGGMTLHDFSRMFEVVPASNDVVTVGGYAVQLLGRVPEKGATLSFGKWTGVVDAVDGKTVRTLRIKRVPLMGSTQQQ